MPPRTISASPFVTDTCALAEGPLWFEDRFWWVDIEPGRLHSVDTAGGDRRTYEFGQKIGVAIPAEDGRFLVGLEKGVGIFDRATGESRILATPEKDVPTNRFNDGKCDPAGRLVGGGLSMVSERGASALYSFEGDFTWRKLYAPVSISNGLAWSQDGGTLYYIDTLVPEVKAFPYDLATGEIGEETAAVKFAPGQGLPDGMTIDAEGNLWVAFWGGWAVRCYSPKTGELLATVEVPCSQVTSCTFGGPNLDRLFITTARIGISEEKLAKEPLAGSIFVCEPGVQGVPVQKFKATV